MIKQANVSKPPIAKKSFTLYLPGFNTKSEAGSKGVIIEIDAEIMMAMANALGSELKFLAVCMAIGNVTKAAAALLIG